MYPSFAVQTADVLRDRALNNPRDYIRFFNDFITVPIDDTTGKQTLFAETADAGATAVTGPADGKGGYLQVACDGDDNDEAYLSSGSEAFIVNGDDEILFEARVKHTAGSTDGKSSFVVGLSDTVGANSIVDAGTLMTSFDGALFIKEEDGNIKFVTSNAASQVETDDVYTWSDGDEVDLGFLIIPNDGTTAKIIPLVNGAEVTDSNGDTIIHDLTISGLQEMHILMGVKTHEASEQTLLIDWIEAVQSR